MLENELKTISNLSNENKDNLQIQKTLFSKILDLSMFYANSPDDLTDINDISKDISDNIKRIRKNTTPESIKQKNNKDKNNNALKTQFKEVSKFNASRAAKKDSKIDIGDKSIQYIILNKEGEKEYGPVVSVTKGGALMGDNAYDISSYVHVSTNGVSIGGQNIQLPAPGLITDGGVFFGPTFKMNPLAFMPQNVANIEPTLVPAYKEKLSGLTKLIANVKGMFS